MQEKDRSDIKFGNVQRVRRCSRCGRRRCLDLEAFLAGPRISGEYLCQPGFAKFYVRQSDGHPRSRPEVRRTIELANIRAKRPGAGAFKRLIAWICQRYPRHYILVECVQTDRFADGLLRMGFKPTRPGRSFWLATPEDILLNAEPNPVGRFAAGAQPAAGLAELEEQFSRHLPSRSTEGRASRSRSGAVRLP